MVDSELVDVLSNGEYVTKLNEVGDWYYIEFTAYNYGYIHKSQLKKYTKYYLFQIKIYYKKHMIFKNRIKK